MAAAIALALAIAGCGGDSSGETTAPVVSIPAVTSPIPATTVAGPAATTTSTSNGTTGTAKGPTSTANRGKKYNPNLPDSATNDVPPPAGSPQQNFEQHCKQNPQACG